MFSFLLLLHLYTVLELHGKNMEMNILLKYSFFSMVFFFYTFRTLKMTFLYLFYCIFSLLGEHTQTQLCFIFSLSVGLVQIWEQEHTNHLSLHDTKLHKFRCMKCTLACMCNIIFQKVTLKECQGRKIKHTNQEIQPLSSITLTYHFFSIGPLMRTCFSYYKSF